MSVGRPRGLTNPDIGGDDALLISGATLMPRLVEDAGGELSAGYVSKRVRFGRGCRSELTLGGRPVRWELSATGVAVAHPAADRRPGRSPTSSRR